MSACGMLTIGVDDGIYMCVNCNINNIVIMCCYILQYELYIVRIMDYINYTLYN